MHTGTAAAAAAAAATVSPFRSTDNLANLKCKR